MPPFQILSLDGGGLRGLFTAFLLERLEEETGVKVADHFDLITGTSTGGIIAIGLSLGLRPAELVRFYLEEGPKIFPPRRGPDWIQRSVHSWIHNWWSAKYRAAALEQALRKKGTFGERLLGECGVSLVVPSFDLEGNVIRLFKTRHHERFRRDHALPAWKVAMATTAAPTFLPAFKGIDGERLIDGGLWANDPSMVGFVEAVSVLGVPAESIRMLSIGTTYGIENQPKHLDNAGWLRWGYRGRVTSALFNAQSSGTSGFVSHMLGPGRLHRINPALDQSFALDSLEPEAMKRAAVRQALTLSDDFKTHFLPHHPKRFCRLSTKAKP